MKMKSVEVTDEIVMRNMMNAELYSLVEALTFIKSSMCSGLSSGKLTKGNTVVEWCESEDTTRSMCIKITRHYSKAVSVESKKMRDGGR